MRENVIFCYSGTGNCLDMAKTIARELGDTDIILMRKEPAVTDVREAQRVGFDTAIVPKHNLKMIDPSQFPGLKLVGVSYLREAINAIKLK